VEQEDMEILQEDQHQMVEVEVKELLHLDVVQPLELLTQVVVEAEHNLDQQEKQEVRE
tara:strand:+ start:498 stop:671 length:174 start_codon:yes stop_codon:yes gene_type:complete